jgi:ATP-dependent Zn protease
MAELISSVETRLKIGMAGELAQRLRRDRLSAIEPDPDGWIRSHDRRETISFHEAGHVIAGALLGLGVPRRVSIVPSGKSGGVTIWEAANVDPSGVPSDRKCNTPFLRILMLAGEARDWKELRGIVRRLRDEVRDLLDHRWPVLELLAWRLLEARELTGPEVAGLIRPYVPLLEESGE